MAASMQSVTTRGYSNGTFAGTASLVATLGYGTGEKVGAVIEFALQFSHVQEFIVRYRHVEARIGFVLQLSHVQGFSGKYQHVRAQSPEFVHVRETENKFSRR